jgi:hypothetical protein
VKLHSNYSPTADTGGNAESRANNLCCSDLETLLQPGIRRRKSQLPGSAGRAAGERLIPCPDLSVIQLGDKHEAFRGGAPLVVGAYRMDHNRGRQLLNTE